MDKNLSWREYIDLVALEISKTIGIIASLRHSVPFRTLSQVYPFLIYSYLISILSILFLPEGQATKTKLEKLSLILRKKGLFG